MAQGLDFEGELARRPGTHLNLLAYTTAFDDYYLYAYGGRTVPAERPSQPLPSPLDEILDGLAADGRKGFLAASEMLLDVPHRERDQVVAYAQRVREVARNERRFSDATAIQVGGAAKAPFGITFMAAPAGTDPGRLARRVGGYSTLKKYQARADRWLGIGTIPGTSRWAAVALTVRGTWEHDNDLDRTVREHLPALRPKVRSHPHTHRSLETTQRAKPKNPRNKPCPCGSGKKWKHCDCRSEEGR